MRQRQREAVADWLTRNTHVTINQIKKGDYVVFELRWREEHYEKAIRGGPNESPDDLLLYLTKKTWKAAEAEDRKNEPTYDRT